MLIIHSRCGYHTTLFHIVDKKKTKERKKTLELLQHLNGGIYYLIRTDRYNNQTSYWMQKKEKYRNRRIATVFMFIPLYVFFLLVIIIIGFGARGLFLKIKSIFLLSNL